jgi:hypothetical protein
MHAKYEIASFNIAKVMAKYLSWTKQTNTDQQTGQKQYVPHYSSFQRSRTLEPRGE